MPLDEAREQVARANRIVANEGVLDAFGHISMRHPNDPNRYLLSRSRAPELIQPEDVLEFTLDSEPVKPPTVRLYGERVIHGEIYKARPEVMAVCHHHAASILPFCSSGVDLKPVYHLGATMGAAVPFWDQRDDFGNTTLIVAKPDEGASLARALGDNWMVLMRRHGATVAGRMLQELVFRTIYTTRNAGMQIQAHALGHVSPLNAEETQLAGDYNLQPSPVARAWEYWNVRLDKAEGTWRPETGKTGKAKRAAAKTFKPVTRKPAARKNAAKRRR
jgi:HCOMODA/2-hydroxy-3-carboxy-muconic semialdehyde decarboxylase